MNPGWALFTRLALGFVEIAGLFERPRPLNLTPVSLLGATP
jgi:hypothetical protein